MKKLIYILVSTLLLVACTTFDEYSSENYGDGSSVELSVSNVTDSTFTLVITPQSDAAYYSYVVQQSADTIDIVAANLLKGSVYKGVSSALLNTKTNATFTTDMRSNGVPLCLPNKVYQIYAVASNAEGIVGKVTQITVKTTDAKKPTPASFSATASSKSASVTFSEAIARSTGAATVTYYKEYDVSNPIVVELAASNISVSGNVVTFTVPDAPAGAFVNFNWEDGAFADLAGNACNAYTTKGFSASTGAQVGIRFRAPTESFDILDSYFVSPVVGSTFLDWTTFEGGVTFDKNIYRVEKNVKVGDLSVIYSTSTRTTTVQLAASNWSVSGATLKFTLPEAPAFGDGVTLNVKAGVFFDVYGNPNAAYTDANTKWSLFKFTEDMLIGKFNFSGYSTYDNTTYDMGDFTSVEDASASNTLKITDFVLSGSELQATYDLDTRKLYLPSYGSLGEVTLSGTLYEMYTYDYVNTTSDFIEFDINANGTIVSNTLALLLYNPATDKLYFYDKFAPATFVKVTTAASVRSYQKLNSAKMLKSAKLIPVTNNKLLSAFREKK